MTFAPAICFTVNSRPEYLAETLASWSRVRGIGDCLLLFQCEPGCPEAAAMCRDVTFAASVTWVAPDRLGVLKAPLAALDGAFTLRPGGQFAVLAEEDLIVSPDVLGFFAWAQRYQADPSVLGVTTHAHDERPGGLAGAGLTDWADKEKWHFWVWGTWRDRWERLLRPNWATSYDDHDGDPLCAGWDWAFRNRLIRGKDMRMVAPSLSRSQHIGKYGGAHCTPAQFRLVRSRCFAGLDVPPQDYREMTWP